jgi:hypothetical protein
LRALRRGLLLSVVVALAVVGVTPRSLLAQSGSAPPTPPELADVILDDPLTTAAVVTTGICPTGRTLGENVGEGFVIKVRGRCLPEQTIGEGSSTLRGLGVWDAEVAVDMKVAVGVSRATIGMYVRVHDRDSLGVTVAPAEGAASIWKRTSGQSTRLVTRRDLAGAYDPTDWNRLAIRVRGAEAWLLLNDEPILYTDQAAPDGGIVYLDVIKEGNPDDEQEVSVVFRNLLVTTLTDAP